MTKKRSPLGTSKKQSLKIEKTHPTSDSPSMRDILAVCLSRRDTLRGGIGLATSTIFAGTGLAALAGCDDSNSSAGGDGGPAPGLSFASVSGSTEADMFTVPPGFVAEILAPWGTPITGTRAAFSGDGSNTAEDQAGQMGQNHDGMYYYPMSQTDPSARGLLAMCHEYSNSTLFAGEGRQQNADGMPTNADEVRKDINAHGASVIEIERDDNGQIGLVSGSSFNRRITAASPTRLSGPAAGSAFMVTPFDNSGLTTRGTLNNCGRGFTPWGTFIACEENIQGYFITNEENPPREADRMGINATGFGYLWSNVAGDPSEDNGEFTRFNITPTGASATEDYRNEANTFGWNVEIDPFDPSSTPVKRTAMGRFRHEGCEPGRITPGNQIAFYMGDDARFEYFYKFVTADAFDPDQPNPDMLDNGDLYVARFDADGSGEWLLLDFARNPALANDFVSQADVLVNTRTAADIVGATPMDRPEWSATDPNSGEIYLTLTNNTDREDSTPPNPRAPNTHGHVIRMGESNDDPAALTFKWDIFVFGSNANADPNFNISGLTADNEFGSPDGLWFDDRGVLWIQTDNGAPLDFGGNDQMLAVIPAQLNGDRTINPDTQASLRRFFVGPAGCEVTGVDMTPDYRTMFVNVQHPGGSWPTNDGTSRPRSSTVVVRREDGGEII